MNSEKRVLLASALSAVVLLLYARIYGQPSPSRLAAPENAKTELSEKNPIQMSAPPSIEMPIHDENEAIVTLESDELKLEIGERSAAIRSATLKKFRDLGTQLPIRLGDNYKVFQFVCPDKQPWTIQDAGTRSALWSCESGGIKTTMSIMLDDMRPVVKLALEHENHTGQTKNFPTHIVVTLGHSESHADVRRYPLEALLKTKKQIPFQREYLTYREGTSKSIPRGTALATLSDRFFCQSLKFVPGSLPQVSVARLVPNTFSVIADADKSLGANEISTSHLAMYFGSRDFFQLRAADFGEAVPVGFLGKIGLILMLMLKSFASITGNYGVGIMLLSVTVTLALSPFTLMSLRSMKKMRDLQPKIEQLRKKYEKDQVRLNQEMFALFKEHRVSPVSGCLPMLLPLPIFFALWSAISHVIELRGASFLWIRDLTVPDRLITTKFGFDVNLLPILMVAAMMLQTKLTQSATPQNDSNKILSGPFMSILFGFMFYTVPSSLALYWFTNSIVTILVYRIAGLKSS